MQIVFMGNYEEGQKSVSLLYDKGYEICAVFTDFDESKPQNILVKNWAIENKILVFPQNSLQNRVMIDKLKNIRPDLIVVVNFKIILTKEILDIPKCGSTNLHSSLLPKYRGRAPISWAIINGEEKTGITIYFVDKGVDTGKIIIQKEMKIEYDDTIKTLMEKQWVIEPCLILEAVKKIERGNPELVVQKEEDATYYHSLSLKDRTIDWNKSSRRIYDLVRALVSPYPGALTYWRGVELTVWWGEEAKYETKMQNLVGTVVDINRNGILVSTGKGGFYLKEMEIKNEKLSHKEFTLKYGLKVGDRLK